MLLVLSKKVHVSFWYKMLDINCYHLNNLKGLAHSTCSFKSYKNNYSTLPLQTKLVNSY